MNKKISAIFIFLFFFTALSGEEQCDKEKEIEENRIRIEELEQRLNEVERATLVDRVDLSMDVRMTVNNYIYREKSKLETKDLGLLREDGETWGQANMMGRLKMVSTLGDRLKFTGWLTMFKQFNESSPFRYESTELEPMYDMGRSRYPSNSRVYFERLFIDLFITDWLAFSIGRGPTSEGAPADIRYDNVELSSFPESAIDSPLDGMYLTFNLEEMFGVTQSYLRLWYVHRIYITDSIKNSFFATKENPYLHFFGIEFDAPVPGVTGGRFYSNFAFSPDITIGERYADLNGNGEEEKLMTPEKLGSLFSWTLLAKFRNINSTPLDFFIGTGGSLISPAVRNKENPNRGFLGTPKDDDGISTPLQTLLGNDLSGGHYVGLTGYAGFRYALPLHIAGEKIKVGGDYNYGSRYFFMYFSPDVTGLNRFSVRGHHVEGYFQIPVHRKAHFKLGYIFEKHDHPFFLMAPAGAGIPEIDERIHNIFLMLNAYF